MASDDLKARDIALMLNGNALALARTLFPAGVEAGGFFTIGSVAGESGHSLKIRLSGDKAGTWADYSCDEGEEAGKGDMLKLAKLALGHADYAETVRWAKGWLGIESMDGDALEKQRKRMEMAQRRAEQRRDGVREDKRQQAEGMWIGAGKLIGSPAMEYLRATRGIDFAAIGAIPSALRFRGDVYHGEHQRKLPAMCSAFWSVDARIVGCHLTFLYRLPDGRWDKLPNMVVDGKQVRVAKKIRGPTAWGGHIPICKGTFKGPLRDIPSGMPVFVAEGIENAASVAMARPDERIVAAGTVGNLGKLELPPQAGDLILICDNDPVGSKAADSLEKQIRAQQLRAREQGSPRKVRCLWPSPEFKDFNDQLRGIRNDG